jgi:nickel/cobalt transporter (NicO) family protein
MRHPVYLPLRLILLLTVCSASVWANPFLGTGGSAAPAAPRAVLGSGTGPFTELQFAFRDKAGEFLEELRTSPSPAILLGFLVASFIYGILHGAGPGHRKTVVFSIFLSRTAPRWYEPLAVGFLSAGLHAATAVAIIGFYSILDRGISRLAHTSSAGIYMEGITFGLLVLFAGYLIVRKILEISGIHEHSHADGPGKNLYSIVIISSLIPCPGASMMMLLAIYLNLIFIGILGVIFMSLGMGLLVSVVGYLAVAGKAGLFMHLKENEHRLHAVADIMEIISYVIILAFSLFMAWPFFMSILS